MNNSKMIKRLVVSFFLLMFSLPSSAGVRSITVEMDAMSGDVRVGKKVIVSCRNGHGKREILKKDDTREWCDTNIGDVCSSKKNVAAQLVCSEDYRQKVASKNSADSEEVAKLKEELIEIEQKRLDIADKVLKLRRRELELQDGA